MSLIARLAGSDPSFFRKVLTGATTPKGSRYVFPDAVVRQMLCIASRIGVGLKLPK